MERWFKHDNELVSSIEYDQIELSVGIRSTPDSLTISNDFSHCLADKLPLALLTTDEEVPNIIELEVHMDGKCFNNGSEESTVLTTEESILFEEVQDTPSVLPSDERENLLSLQSKVVDIVEDKISLLTPHELESMKVNALDSDSEKETQTKNDSNVSECKLKISGDKIPKPLVVLHEDETLYICPIEECSKGFPKLVLAKSHIMSHIGARQFKCDTEGCSWSFFSEYKLKRHKECHQGKKDFVCTVCCRKFTTLYNLNSHKKLHDRPNIFCCSIEQCNSEFQTQRELDNHLKDQHRDVEAPYVCPHCNCGKRFYSLNALTTHLRSHSTRTGPLVCQWEGCSRSFDRPSHLESHLRTHTGDRPFVCHFEGCGWAFRTPSKLSRHQRTHKNERPFKCPHEECHKAYLRSEHLKQHLLSQHRGMKMFRCPVENCGAEFTARSTLYVHAKRHNIETANLTFPCEHPGCNKQYSGKSNLRKHMVRCHGIGSTMASTDDAAHLEPSPPELIKAADTSTHNDYIALFLGDDEDHTVADRSVVTLLAVPSDTLQDSMAPSVSESNLCVLVHASNDSSTNSSNQPHILWSWPTTSPMKSMDECSDFGQSTINMRDLE